MDVADFDFDLPDELIAQDPPAVRGGSRLLALTRPDGAIAHWHFADLARVLRPGDLLVVNDTRVFPARLLGHRVPSGGAVECLLVSREADAERRADGPTEVWQALMHPGQKLKPGAQVLFERAGTRIRGEVLERRFHGRRTIQLQADGGLDLMTAIERIGHIPLPPYIHREDRASDRDRYQTVYARDRGSIAAPTAGLHFTPDLLASLVAHGVVRASVTLHVGYGTFKPVRVDRIEDHEVDPERVTVSMATAAALTAARREGRRIIAVGTTTVRALESLTAEADGTVQPVSGETRLFVAPGHQFRLVDGLITNFHLPRSSLLMLVSAFGGHAAVMDAYRAAVAERYRFYSYGDAMVIL